MDIKIYYGDEKCEKFTVYRSKIWTKKIREFMKEAQKMRRCQNDESIYVTPKGWLDLVNGYIFYQCTDLSLGNRRYKNCSFWGGAYILLIMIPATIGNLDFDKNMVPVIENLVKKKNIGSFCMVAEES